MTNMKQTQDDRTIQPFNCSTIQRVKAYAFTLAETLIVIGIIGVVAALTLPNLNQATGDKEKVTRLKKMYSSITEAVDRAQVIYGPIDEWWPDDEYSGNHAYHVLFSRLEEFMKVSKIEKDGDDYIETLILTDSSSIHPAYTINDYNPSRYHRGEMFIASLHVDLDGPGKGKNEIGKDIFRFDITNKGVYPDDIVSYFDDEDTNQENLVDKCFSSGYCALWVIQNDNMDYLKADETGKCPDGTQLSWTVTSCN